MACRVGMSTDPETRIRYQKDKAGQNETGTTGTGRKAYENPYPTARN